MFQIQFWWRLVYLSLHAKFSVTGHLHANVSIRTLKRWGLPSNNGTLLNFMAPTVKKSGWMSPDLVLGRIAPMSNWTIYQPAQPPQPKPNPEEKYGQWLCTITGSGLGYWWVGSGTVTLSMSRMITCWSILHSELTLLPSPVAANECLWFMARFLQSI